MKESTKTALTVAGIVAAVLFAAAVVYALFIRSSSGGEGSASLGDAVGGIVDQVAGLVRSVESMFSK